MSKKGLVSINDKRCKACGICIDLCPKKVLAARSPLLKAIVASPELCSGCMLCELYCPDWAVNVTVLEREGGRDGD